MEKVVVMYKKRGETPREALERLREEKKDELGDETPLTYAGRLDPLAEGALIVLVGDEIKNKKRYLDMEKEYRCEVLFGFSSDTYDVLGKLSAAPTKIAHPRVRAGLLLKAVSDFVGTSEEEYPPYSSKRVRGKALFEWAREGRISEIKVPTHTVTVSESILCGLRTERIEKLWQDIDTRIMSVKGDFRQKEIRDCWWESVRPLYDETCDIATIHFKVSSGAYIRSFAHDLGKKLGIPALAFSIVRTRIGSKYAVPFLLISDVERVK